jgi:hypothetical protein
MGMFTQCGCPECTQQIWNEFSDHTNASFVCHLTACASVRSDELCNDIRVLSALMNFYTKTGDAVAAMKVWDDLVTECRLYHSQLESKYSICNITHLQ